MEPKWHEHEIGYSQEHRDIQSRYWPAPMMDKYAKERVCLVPSQQFRGNSPSRFIDGKEALEKDDVLSFKIQHLRIGVYTSLATCMLRS